MQAPTFADAGVKGMDVAQLWWGMFAPKGLPPDIMKKMNDGINEALERPGDRRSLCEVRRRALDSDARGDRPRW